MCASLLGCTEDLANSGGNGGSGGSTPPPLDNDAINSALFENINLEYPGLEAVKLHFEGEELYLAAEELLKYYRKRNYVINPRVNLITPSIGSGEQKWADDAFASNDYRFYVKNYYDPKIAGGNTPYSYKKGDGIDWQYWPTKENEQRFQLHRHQWFPYQGKAYRVSKNEKYATEWINVYSDWLTQNPYPDIELNYGIDPSNQPEGYENACFVWRPLDTAARALDQCDLFQYFMHSHNFTPEWLSTFLVNYALHINHIVANYTAEGNHRITQGQAVVFAGVLFPEFKKADEWLSSGSSVLSVEVDKQFLDDGMSWELDLSYLIGSIEDFRSAMLVANINGKGDKFPPAYVESMRKMTDVVMNLIYPNYTIPNMNDTRGSQTKRVLLRNLTNYYNLFPDNTDMQWMASEGVSGIKPTHLTKAFKESGYYVLKSGWDKSSIMMIQQNGPRGGWHNQPDNGTFELYINNRNFFPDTGVFSYAGDYEANKNRAKYAATKEHNTMTLNGKTLTDGGRNGKLLKLTTESNTDILVTENPSYVGLKHRRSIFFVNKTFFVLVDEGVGNAVGNVNLNFNLAEPTSKGSVVVDILELGAHTAFSDNNNILIRSFSSEAIEAVEKPGFVSYDIGKSIDRPAYQINQNKSADKNVRVITIILPCADASARTIDAEFSDDGYSESGLNVKVTVDGVTYPLNYKL